MLMVDLQSLVIGLNGIYNLIVQVARRLLIKEHMFLQLFNSTLPTLYKGSRSF